MKRIAVVGAGLSGLVVASRLHDLADVTLFEKSRGTGGRMATRYAGDFEFDHGAQFFTARTGKFRRFLRPLIEAGIVANWQGTFAELDRADIASLRSWDESYPHFVGAPRMNSIAKSLAAGLNIELETTVSSIERHGNGWTLTHESGISGPYDWLVLTAPARQTAALAGAFPGLASFSTERRMLGCYALMLGFPEPVDLQWQAALVSNGGISWISINSSKPGRNDLFTMVVHSTNAWADAHMEDDIEVVLEHMLDETSLVTGHDLRRAEHREVHRWRYANIARQEGPAHYLDVDNNIGACGDWCVRGRIEAAYTSASGLAETLALEV